MEIAEFIRAAYNFFSILTNKIRAEKSHVLFFDCFI